VDDAAEQLFADRSGCGRRVTHAGAGNRRQEGDPIARENRSQRQHGRQEARVCRHTRGHPETRRTRQAQGFMTRFRYGHATHPNWRMATELALAQVEGRINQPGWARDANLGVVYLSAEYAAHADDIVALLEERTGVRDWAGTCGHAIVSTGVEYDSEPAIAIMLLDLPADSFRVFSGAMPPPLAGERTQSGALAAQAALIHADPATPDLAELIGDMAGKVGGGMMFGGSASGQVEPLIQVANQVLSGGLSGVVFSSEVDLRMRVTQGCSPLAG
jgi:small ligand-binding sensory domain FIST